MGSILVEGSETIVWARGSVERKQNVSFMVKAWQAIGGASANSSIAMKYLLKQVEELASNRDAQPLFIQWTATADPTALLNATELHDGWYVIDNFEPNYARNVVTALVECRMTVTAVAPAPPRSVAMAYAGGALASDFSGVTLNLISLPIGSTALEATFNRTAAEGSVPTISVPAASPEPLVLSATLANIFKGGVHVYDTINTSSNPVPTSGGTFVHANWVEVFDTQHNFAGDCVITNGLLLFLFQTGQTQVVAPYIWSTGLVTTNWQACPTIQSYDNAGQLGTLRQYSLKRVGPEECSIAAVSSSAGAQVHAVTLRLQRGRNDARIDVRSLTQANTSTGVLTLNWTALVNPKIVYNETALTDNNISRISLAASTQFGYSAVFAASASHPFITGWLYQNRPASQPSTGGGNASYNDLGETSAPALNAQRAYGFFAIPFGVFGSYGPTNLQVEAEGGVLGTGWTNVVDAAQSAGHVAKCASGTTTGNGDGMNQSQFTPPLGFYDLWFRVKVTSAAGATPEMKLGLAKTSDNSFIASTTYAANQVTTGYVWYRAVTAVSPSVQCYPRAETTATLGTDWFIDEAALVPRSLTSTLTGPQDIWQQFMYDRSVRMIRP